MTASDGLARWIAEDAPGAVAGSGGHAATFTVACALWRMLDDEAAVWARLEEYNRTRCDPPWSERELRHKLAEGDKATAGERRPRFRNARGTRRNARGASLADFSAALAAPPRRYAVPSRRAPSPALAGSSDKQSTQPETDHDAGQHRANPDTAAALELAAISEGSEQRSGQTAPAATPTGALRAWLLSLRVPADPDAPPSSRWSPPRQAPELAAPPYCLDLAGCLGRIDAGEGSAADAARVRAWIPNGAACALALRQRDREHGEKLLRELLRLEGVCEHAAERAAHVAVNAGSNAANAGAGVAP